MVLLTLTAAGKAAVDEYCECQKLNDKSGESLERLSAIELGSAIDHNDLIDISRFLVERSSGSSQHEGIAPKAWRLDTLLQGATVYQAPPAPKPEPSSEYKALMKRLRQEEEQRQYELMINPPPLTETFNQRFPNAAASFGGPQIPSNTEIDEVTYADVNRQMALIINVLVSIIACSVAIWIAARRWEVHQRLALSMCGSGLVAVAEVAIYMGYIRRIKDAKEKERGMVERKEIMETWVLDGKKIEGGEKRDGDGVRFRKGKHR